jgi:streptomycin 3"-kinase
LVMTAIPGVPAADLPGSDLLKAWPSMARQLGSFMSCRSTNARLIAVSR